MRESKLLVIVNDLFYHSYVTDQMADTGVVVVGAQGGKNGLELVVKEKPDVIVMDAELPDVPAAAVLRTLRGREQIADIPVVVMVGAKESSLVKEDQTLSDESDAVLLKPFSRDELVEKVREARARRGRQQPGPADNSDDDQPAGNGLPPAPKVLVVDDSPNICDIASGFIREVGMEAFTAADGAEGLKRAKELVPDLVILDVQMPKINGFVVCEMLKKSAETKHIPIVLMSAIVDNESFERHSKLRYSADSYLQKPFTKAQIQDLVTSYTSQAHIPGQAQERTGFIVPPEEDLPTPGEEAEATADQVAGQLAQTQLESKVLSEAREELEEELLRVRQERDTFEEEAVNLKKMLEETGTDLDTKLKAASRKAEEAVEKSARLEKELEDSGREAGQASEEKITELTSEIERLKKENADLLDADAGKPDLSGELAEAQEKLAEYETEQNRLAEKLAEAEANTKWLEDLQAELDR
jgi:CheY-like chemotaxis protein